jgi:hypothetical protein
MDKTTKTLMLAALTALMATAPVALADAGETDGGEAAAGDTMCQPVWVDIDGKPHVDPTCLPVLDNRP